MSTTKPIGSSHSRLNHLLDRRARGGDAVHLGIEPAQVAGSMTSSPGELPPIAADDVRGYACVRCAAAFRSSELRMFKALRRSLSAATMAPGWMIEQAY